MNFIKNCDDGKHIITILDNSTMTMDENCDFHTNMCSSLVEYQQALVAFLNLNLMFQQVSSSLRWQFLKMD